MAFRIFDHVLIHHAWSATGDLCIVQEPTSAASYATGTAKAERDSLRARLAVRSKPDRIMCRAARRLIACESISFDDLARELGVTRRYLLAGLRAAFGVDPHRW